MQLRQYGVACNVYFPLIDKGATDFEATPVPIAAGDCKISKDGGAFSNTNSNFAHLAGGVYSLALTATEMQAKNVVIKIIDQTGTKEWEDQAIILDTVNHASAEIPSMWSIPQSTASGAITSSSFAAGAINAAAIASDAITAAKVADGAIDAATFAAGAINAAAIAADAIGASELAADAVAEIADAVWDEAQSGHTTAGTFGKYIDSQLSVINDAVDTEVAAIKAKTDNLPAFPAAASDCITASGVRAAVGLSSANLDTQLTAIDDYIDTEVAAIKAKTDNLPSDPADASDIAASFATVNSKLDAIDDYVDTEVAAIKAQTDLIPASPAAVGDIPTAATIAQTVLRRSVVSTDDEDNAGPQSLSGAILKLTSKFVAATGVTYKGDGTTAFMTQTPSTDPAADPVTALGVGV